VRKMSAQASNDELLIHWFQDSLIGAALIWYMGLDRIDIKKFNDLCEAFIQRYNYNLNLAADRDKLQAMTQNDNESFKAYAQLSYPNFWPKMSLTRVVWPYIHTQFDMIDLWHFSENSAERYFKIPHFLFQVDPLFSLLLLLVLLIFCFNSFPSFIFYLLSSIIFFYFLISPFLILVYSYLSILYLFLCISLDKSKKVQKSKNMHSYPFYY